MKTERRRSILIILATFLIGILIGALGDGLLEKQRLERGGWRKDGKEAFLQKMFSIIEADDAQQEKLRPLILESMAKVDSLQAITDSQVRVIVDALQVKLQPILSEEQMERLKEFHRRGRERR